MAQLEKDIERKLRCIVEAHGGMCVKWVCPGWAGVPDRICLLPGGRVFFVETKRPKGGRISKRQEWWHRRLTRLGFRAGFVFDNDDLEAFKNTLEVLSNVYTD